MTTIVTQAKQIEVPKGGKRQLQVQQFSEARKQAEKENLLKIADSLSDEKEKVKVVEALAKLNAGTITLEELDSIKGTKIYKQKQTDTGGVTMAEAKKKNSGTGPKGKGLVEAVRNALKVAGKDLKKEDFEKIVTKTGAKIATVRTQYYLLRKK